MEDKSVSLEASDSAESDDDLLEYLFQQNQKPQSTLSAITKIEQTKTLLEEIKNFLKLLKDPKFQNSKHKISTCEFWIGNEKNYRINLCFKYFYHVFLHQAHLSNVFLVFVAI